MEKNIVSICLFLFALLYGCAYKDPTIIASTKTGGDVTNSRLRIYNFDLFGNEYNIRANSFSVQHVLAGGNELITPSGSPINVPNSVFTDKDSVHLTVSSNAFNSNLDTVLHIAQGSFQNIYILTTDPNNSQPAKIYLPNIAAPSSPASGMCKIRVLNLGLRIADTTQATGTPQVPAAGPVSLTLNRGGQLSSKLQNVGVLQTSDYFEMPYGTYVLKAVAADGSSIGITYLDNNFNFFQTDAEGNPVTYPKFLKSGGCYTLVIRYYYDQVTGFWHPYYQIVEEAVFPQSGYANVQFCDALPNSQMIDFSVDGTSVSTGNSLGQYTTPIPIPAGEHTLKFSSNGQTLVKQQVTLRDKDNFTVFVYERAGKPAVHILSNSLANSFANNQSPFVAETRYLNLSPDAGYMSFADENGQVVDSLAYSQPLAKYSFLDPATKTVIPSISYDAFYGWTAYPNGSLIPIELHSYYKPSADSPGLGTEFIPAKVNYPFLGVPGNSRAKEGYYLSVFLGRITPGAPAAEAGRTIVIPLYH